MIYIDAILWNNFYIWMAVFKMLEHQKRVQFTQYKQYCMYIDWAVMSVFVKLQ